MGTRPQTILEEPLPPRPAPGRLVRGMLFLSGGEIAAKLFCFFAFTHIGRLLGPERYGSLEFVLALIVFFTLPADSGLGSYGAREIARGRFGAPRLMAGIATLRLLLALGSFAVLVATVLALPAPTGLLLAIYGLGFLLMPLQLQWLFQGRGRMEWVAAASVVRYGVFAALIFFGLRSETTLIRIGIFECVSLLASVVAVRLGGAGRLEGHVRGLAPAESRPARPPQEFLANWLEPGILGGPLVSRNCLPGNLGRRRVPRPVHGVAPDGHGPPHLRLDVFLQPPAGDLPRGRGF